MAWRSVRPPQRLCALGRLRHRSLQAFRYAARAYGLLFHLEMEENGIESLSRECAPDLTKARLTVQQVKAAALPISRNSIRSLIDSSVICLILHVDYRLVPEVA